MAARILATSITITRKQLAARLEARVEAIGGLTAAARAWQISPGYLGDVLAGRYAPGPRILRALGLRKRDGYEEVNPHE